MSPRKTVSYKDSGVDIDAGDDFVEHLKKVNPSIGGFGGFLSLPHGIKHPKLVLSTDGVGTKLLVAQEAGRFDTIGIDLVAMVVNDIVTTGAKPLAFLDYYAVEKLDAAMSKEIIKGILAGCEQAGCELLGGETAELPGIYPKGGFDLAGFGVGVVEKGAALTGNQAEVGDVVIGLPSSGIHSNGYSLARRVLLEGRKAPKGAARRAVLDAMLVPTSIYVEPILKLMKKVDVKGIAHITGGGLLGNLPRVLGEGQRAVLDPATWELPEIFAQIQERGPVDPAEMYRVFNMGIGMCVLVGRKDAKRAVQTLRRAMVHAVEIGRIGEGECGVTITGIEGATSGA